MKSNFWRKSLLNAVKFWFLLQRQVKLYGQGQESRVPIIFLFFWLLWQGKNHWLLTGRGVMLIFLWTCHCSPCEPTHHGSDYASLGRLTPEVNCLFWIKWKIGGEGVTYQIFVAHYCTTWCVRDMNRGKPGWRNAWKCPMLRPWTTQAKVMVVVVVVPFIILTLYCSSIRPTISSSYPQLSSKTTSPAPSSLFQEHKMRWLYSCLTFIPVMRHWWCWLLSIQMIFFIFLTKNNLDCLVMN